MIIKGWYFTEGMSILHFILPGDNARIGGTVYGHPDIEDGRHIKTYRIKSFNKTEVTTMDGLVWKLQNIHPLYAEYLKNEGIVDLEKVA